MCRVYELRAGFVAGASVQGRVSCLWQSLGVRGRLGLGGRGVGGEELHKCFGRSYLKALLQMTSPKGPSSPYLWFWYPGRPQSP